MSSIFGWQPKALFLTLNNEDFMTRKEAVNAVVKKAAPKKKTSPDATKAGKAAKAAGDKALVDMATNLPHGAGKQFLVLTKGLDEIEDKMELLNKQKRGIRASLKEMKVELRPYDHVRKLRKMEIEDVKSFEASVALYKDQLDMPLSVHQQVIKKELEGQREAARDAMIDAGGGDSGKEIGTSSQPAGNGQAATISASVAPPAPERNDNFRPPASVAAH
jgi:hypothetical protein